MFLIYCKVEKIKVAWIQSHHLHLQWKFKLWAGHLAWGVKAKHCRAFEKKFVDITQQCFALLPQVNFSANNLHFHWRWRWWDQIQAIFLNIFYFTWWAWIRKNVDIRRRWGLVVMIVSIVVNYATAAACIHACSIIVRHNAQLTTYVTIMCRNDELSSTMSWVGCLLKDSELYLICRK